MNGLAQASNRAIGGAEAIRGSEVGSQLNRGSDAINHLESLVAQLDSRLGPLLRPQTLAGAGSDGAKSAPEEVLSAHGDELRNLAKRTERVNASVMRMLDTLAV